MKKLFLSFVVFLFASDAFAHVTSEIFCFSSGDKKPARFEMRTYFDRDVKWEGAFIKYENSKIPIALVLKNTQEEILNKNRPYQTTKTWLEISNNKISGEYEMISQGANIYSMTYTNFGKKKRFAFGFDTNVVSSLSSGCTW